MQGGTDRCRPHLPSSDIRSRSDRARQFVRRDALEIGARSTVGEVSKCDKSSLPQHARVRRPYHSRHHSLKRSPAKVSPHAQCCRGKSTRYSLVLSYEPDSGVPPVGGFAQPMRRPSGGMTRRMRIHSPWASCTAHSSSGRAIASCRIDQTLAKMSELPLRSDVRDSLLSGSMRQANRSISNVTAVDFEPRARIHEPSHVQVHLISFSQEYQPLPIITRTELTNAETGPTCQASGLTDRPSGPEVCADFPKSLTPGRDVCRGVCEHNTTVRQPTKSRWFGWNGKIRLGTITMSSDFHRPHAPIDFHVVLLRTFCMQYASLGDHEGDLTIPLDRNESLLGFSPLASITHIPGLFEPSSA